MTSDLDFEPHRLGPRVAHRHTYAPQHGDELAGVKPRSGRTPRRLGGRRSAPGGWRSRRARGCRAVGDENEERDWRRRGGLGCSPPPRRYGRARRTPRHYGDDVLAVGRTGDALAGRRRHGRRFLVRVHRSRGGVRALGSAAGQPHEAIGPRAGAGWHQPEDRNRRDAGGDDGGRAKKCQVHPAGRSLKDTTARFSRSKATVEASWPPAPWRWRRGGGDPRGSPGSRRTPPPCPACRLRTW